MSEINLTVNGNKIKGQTGNTVLEICQANAIDIPTLCHFKTLSDVGACRMCLVEIEGERRPVPSCTYPARDGLVVKTHTEQLEKTRRLILELIFSEHNHFCMFCEQSGDCELQQLAYKYQMDNVRYAYTFPTLPVDSLNPYLVIDHNRCILCGRCVRVCSEVVANNTLEFGQRGLKTIVTADLDQPLGESTCISCGACFQVCPTGAIFSKLSLYKDKTGESKKIATICPGCGVGCELNVLVKDNNLVRIDSADPTSAKGTLCYMGRFELLKDSRSRITTPLVRGKLGEMEPCSLNEAIDAIVKGFGKTDSSISALASARIPHETLLAFKKLISATGNDMTESFKNAAGVGGSIEDLLKADCILVVEADPAKTHPVIANLIRRAMREKKANLAIVDSEKDSFFNTKHLWLKPNKGSTGVLLNGIAKIILDNKIIPAAQTDPGVVRSLKAISIDDVVKTSGVDKERIELLAGIYGRSHSAVIIYGEGVIETGQPELITSILTLAHLTGSQAGDKLKVLGLTRGINSRDVRDIGQSEKGDGQGRTRGLYLLLADDTPDDATLRRFRGAGFSVVQASYHSAATEMADVVLPSPIWAEREGTYAALDGAMLKANHLLEPEEGVVPDEKIFTLLAKKLGCSLK